MNRPVSRRRARASVRGSRIRPGSAGRRNPAFHRLLVEQLEDRRLLSVYAFEEVFKELLLELPDGSRERVLLNGQATMEVNIGESGEAADTDGDKLDQVSTELLRLELKGTSSLGPIQVFLDPSRPSLGEIEERANEKPEILEIAPFAEGRAADSFFDVFVQIEIGGQVLHTDEPERWVGTLNHLPPAPGDTYWMENTKPVALLDDGDNFTGLWIVDEQIMLEPVQRLDVFPSVQKELVWQLPNGDTERVQLGGSMTVATKTNEYGTAADTDGDGLDQVATEVVALDLRGTSSLGPVRVSLGEGSSRGETEERINFTPGTLDLPPFAREGIADSFFDVFLQIEIAEEAFFTETAEPLQAVLTQFPPAPGETYQTPEEMPPIELRDANGHSTGLHIVREWLTPTPEYIVERFPFVEKKLVLATPQGGTEDVWLSGTAAVRASTDDAGWAADTDGDGLEQVPAELVELHLVGMASWGAAVEMRLDPAKRSFGEFEEWANETLGTLDVPPFTENGMVDSFFDVWPEIVIGTQVLHAESAERLSATLKQLPPGPGETYGTPLEMAPIALVDWQGAFSGYQILGEELTLNPEHEVDHFPHIRKELVLQLPTGVTERVLLHGTGTVEVAIDPAGAASDTDGNGLEQVSAVWTELNLAGLSSLGPVLVRLDPTRWSWGEIEELVNNTPGTLDVPPFTPTGSAFSFFDVFLQIELGGYVLTNAEPERLRTIISHKPPAPGETYATPPDMTPIILLPVEGEYYDGQYPEFWLLSERITPIPAGKIQIIKDAEPDDPHDFTFLSPEFGQFSLDDDSDPTLPNSRTFTNLAAGVYTVVEQPVANWNLAALVIDDPDGGSTIDLGTGTATIDLDPGETITVTFTNRLNQPPVADAGGPYVVDEGGSVVLDASDSDDDVGIVRYEWDFDSDGTYDHQGTEPTATFSAASLDGPLNQPIRLRVTDDAGLTHVATALVQVRNVAPRVSDLELTPQIDEGGIATLSGTVLDPCPADSLTLELDWSDGTTQSIPLVAPLPDGVTYDPLTGAFTVPHQYPDDGPSPGNATSSDLYAVTGRVLDDDGGWTRLLRSAGPRVANDDNETGWSVTQQIQVGEPIGQTFTAISNNPLDLISFYVADMNSTVAPTDYSLTFELYEGLGISGRLLGRREYSSLSDGFSGFISADFSAVTLVDGQVYTATLVNDTARWGRKAVGNQYAGGTALYAGAPSPTADALFIVQWQPDAAVPRVANEDNDTGWSVTQQIQVGEPIGQTFTAISNNPLEAISFYVADMNSTVAPTDYSLTFELYEGLGTGGRLLGRREYTELSDGFSGFIEVDFSAVTLVEGQAYTAVLVNDTARWGRVACGNQYAGGTALYAGAASPTADALFIVQWQPDGNPPRIANDTNDTGWSVTQQIQVGEPIGQTFTAISNNRLSELAFHVADMNATIAPTDYSLTFELYEGVGVSGRLLGRREYSGLSDGFSGFVEVDFSSVALVAGQQYTAVLSNDTARWGRVACGNQYAGGTAIYAGAVSPTADALFRVEWQPDGAPLQVSNDDNDTGWSVTQQILAGEPLGQTFTAISNNRLSTVAFYVADMNASVAPDDDSVTFELYEGVGTGGRLLGRREYTGLATGHTGFIEVDFSAVTLVDGDVYTAVLANDTARWGRVACGNQYAGGTALYANSPSPTADALFRVVWQPDAPLPRLANDDNDTGWSVTQQILAGEPLGQTFTAISDQRLASVAFYVADMNSEVAPEDHAVTFALYEGVGAGGRLLGTRDSRDLPDGHTGFVDVDFSAVTLVAGQRYTAVVTNDTARWGRVAIGNQYAGGTALYADAPSPTSDALFQIGWQPTPAVLVVEVDNVAPAFDAGADVTLAAGAGSFARSIAFTDPGLLDRHTVMVDYGDGSPAETISVALGARQFDLAHTYADAGDFPVTVTVSDDDGGHWTDDLVVSVRFWDWGDAPDSAAAAGYPTLAVHNGARHQLRGPWLGGADDKPDAESDGQPHLQALGDDLSPSGVEDDEDGAVFPPLVVGQTNYVFLEVTTDATLEAYVDGWIDWNGDKTWDASERFVGGMFGNGVHHVPVAVPAIAVPGSTFARVRVSSTGGLDPTGPAGSGEVEDHEVRLVALPENTKWVQLPDLSPNGIDVRMDAMRMLADDFECRATSLLTDVHLWGSWKEDAPGKIESIELRIHPDDPVGPVGTDTQNEFSKPEPEVLWARNFGRDEFTEQLYYTVPEPGEYWWDPLTGELVPGGDSQVWQLDIPIDPDEAFLQRGTEDKPVIYWLDVRVTTSEGEFGWKTRQWPEHFMDDAVWTSTMPPWYWQELQYPERHPYGQQEPNSIDLAFALTFEGLSALIDWGDAPEVAGTAGYPTTKLNDGARHVIRGPWLGDANDRPDDELDGQPESQALGDDLSPLPGYDDENGVVIPPLVWGQTNFVSFEVSLPPSGLGQAYVDGWIDFDGDKTWDAAEQFVSGWFGAGMHTVAVTPPAASAGVADTTFARVRINSQGPLGPTGLALDGEVEDYEVRLVAWDWGDAPEGVTAAGYPTLAISNGARHVIRGPWLGDRTDNPDAEPDGQPHVNALGDDWNPAAGDDEDGVVIPMLVMGQTTYASFEVYTLPNQPAYVDGWIDFNGDKTWDAAEQFVSGWFGPGTHTVPVTPPASSVLGQTFARVRINSRGPLGPTGPAGDGEVEDHLVRLVALPENTKWVQLPDLSPHGIDVQVDGLRVAADDFECRETGLLTGIRLWGSWKDDLPGRLENIQLTIHRDDPAGADGADPNNRFSQPDPVALWSLDVGADQYVAKPYYTLAEPGEYWWDPLTGELVAGADRRVWQIDIPIDPEVAFLQEGTEQEPLIYWLQVRVRTEWGEFGWKTRQWPDHFMDDAVWDAGSELPRIWQELRYPAGHPYHGLEKDSIDLAFALTSTDVVRRFVVNSTGDTPDLTVGDGICDDGSGFCTLRAALQETNAGANSLGGPDEIVFDLPGTGPHTIRPLSALPAVIDPVVIDATTQPGYAGAPVVELDGSLAGAGANGLRITAGGSALRGLAVNRFAGSGIELAAGSGNLLQRNYIGTDLMGSQPRGNGLHGVRISDSAWNTIGGTSPGEGNVISGNTLSGVAVLGSGALGNLVQGNRLGTDSSGLVAVANGNHGVLINGAPDNTVGGLVGGAGNVISGNHGSGVYLVGTAAAGNLVVGNHIGTNLTATSQLANGEHGMTVVNAPDNTIGGTAAGAGNLISGNVSNGLYLSGSGASGNAILGNRVGTDSSGLGGLGNGTQGIRLNGAPGNLIGGSSPEAANVVSANGAHGIWVDGDAADGNRIVGNLIGTDATGTLPLGNAGHGLLIKNAAFNEVLGNAISANGFAASGTRFSGVYLTGNLADRNAVLGNLIGTDVTGEFAMGNASHGVVIVQGGVNQIGGAAPEAGNVVSANGGSGVYVVGSLARLNKIQGNWIGTNSAGTEALGNGQHGIAIVNAISNTVGGIVADAGNLISGNTFNGVYLAGSTSSGNVIQGNRIGTDLTGTLPLGNGTCGVRIQEASGTQIGGRTTSAANIIGGNAFGGVYISDSTATENLVEGNWIGTDPSGAVPLDNANFGVLISGGGNNTVGGTAVGAGNTIAFQAVGVRIQASSGNRIQQNSLFAQTTIGIDLGTDGATANDSDDPDTGPNQLQNYPELTAAVLSGTTLVISYSVPSSTANSAYPLGIEFFLADAAGREGQTYLGGESYPAPGADAVALTVSGMSFGQLVVATATDANGNTSEFSPSIAVTSSLESTVMAEGEVSPAELGSLELTRLAGQDPAGWASAAWAFAGFDATRLAKLPSPSSEIRGLPRWYRRLTPPDGSVLEFDAADCGWFVAEGDIDAVDEFDRSDSKLHLDLLTTVMREVGRVWGLPGLEDEDDLIDSVLRPGTRHLPTADDIDRVLSGEDWIA
jgi:CSLREA domain-containing protein